MAIKKLISHRGNINGKIPEMENQPDYIDKAIEAGYDVEIDFWKIDDNLYLGHDNPTYEITYDWLKARRHKLWVHCKNIRALEFMDEKIELHYFWHEEDTLTLTSRGNIWAYPNKQPIYMSVAVMPEIHNDDVSKCWGVCSDYIIKYKNEYNL